jgi:origin recognition complex subunit 4
VPSNITLPSSSQLLALISVLPTLSKSVIVILDGFDLFALHPRQSLLYCLLDAVQSCHAQSKGLAVIGITSHVDPISLLEKRVKSRFSGRVIRTGSPRRLHGWLKIVKTVLSSDISHMSDTSAGDDCITEWTSLWEAEFLEDNTVLNIFNEVFSVTRDIGMLKGILVNLWSPPRIMYAFLMQHLDIDHSPAFARIPHLVFVTTFVSGRFTVFST